MKLVNEKGPIILLAIICSCLFSPTFAAEGKDLLLGTSNDLIATMQGTGKTFLYLGEIAMCGYMFIKSRNPMVFAGVIVLAVGFNVVFKIAGII